MPAGHLVRRGFLVEIEHEAINWVAIATDGVTDVLEHFACPDWSKIARYDSDQLRSLLERIDRWESNEDPDGRQLPCAKRHDDKTIAAIPSL